MAKFNINLLYSALLCVAVTSNLALAANDAYDLNVIHDYLNTFEKQVFTLECLRRSCDPLVFQKMVEIENDLEKELRARSTWLETHEFETVKVLRALETSIEKILLAEPKCRDLSYSCPSNPATVHIPPKFLIDYSNVTRDIVTYGRRCVNLNNVQDAITIVGDAVEYVEDYNPNVPGNYFQRAMPALRFVANEYLKLCNGNP